MDEPNKNEYNNNFHGEVRGSAFGPESEVHYYYSEVKEHFDEKNIEKLESDFKNALKVEDSIREIIKEEKLLVLGGDLGINKDELALYLALLRAKEITSANYNNGSVSIKQWRRSSNQHLSDLENELRKSEDTAIFVVHEVKAKDVESNWFNKIYEAAAKSQEKYVLVTTDISFTSLRLEENARKFFPDLKEEDIYSQETVVKYLNDLLVEKSLLKKLEERLSAENKSLKSVAEALRTVTNVRNFVGLFKKEVEQSKEKEGEGKKQKISDLIESAKDNKQFIRTLYYDILEPREQLLALGLSLFNGLFEDQLFAALERVVEEVWQKRDPSLRALDYYDLGKIQDNYFQLAQNNDYEIGSPHFKVVETKDYELDISSINILSDKRLMLFKVAWESHRRQILTALNVLVDLVKESVVVVEKEYHKFKGGLELYSHPIGRDQLLSAISKTLSDISLVSTSALVSVQGALEILARDQNKRLRYFAASVIARWYDSAHRDEQKLFRTLQSFYGITLEKENKESSAEDNEGGSEDREVPDYIGSTVALTVRYAIYYYNDSHSLSDRFYEWLEELSQSRLRIVNHDFGYDTLYWVVPKYLKQEKMRKLLKKIAQTHREWFSPRQNLNHQIARSFAHACYKSQDNREEVSKLLDEWYNECYNNPRNIKYNELLKTIALTYGQIKYDEQDQQGPLTVKYAFHRLTQILEKEKHPSVREAVVFSSRRLVSLYFESIESQLADSLSEFNGEERQEIVATITEIYRKQIDRVTAIEKAMNNWAKLKDKPLAQQTAIQALVSFAS